MKIKAAIVEVLAWACGVIDNVPALRRADSGSWRSLRFFRHGCLGCYPLGLANKSVELDDRWGTNVWEGGK